MADKPFDLAIDKAKLRATLAPFVVETLAASDPRWQARLAALSRRWRNRLLKRRLLGWLPDVRRTEAYVNRSYSQTWSALEWPDISPNAVDAKPTAVQWGDKGMIVRRHGLGRVTMMLQAQAAMQLAPENGLEVGFGSGMKLVNMASMMPRAKWTGVELTDAGVARAQSLQQAPALPERLRAYLPMPLADPMAYRAIEFRQGNAQKLPFADGSFELVYTHRALEQMNGIRNDAMAEIARVCRGHALFVEPFAEFNADRLSRSYIAAKDYFAMRLAELPRFGLEVVFATDDVPQNIVNRIAIVVARKRPAR